MITKISYTFYNYHILFGIMNQSHPYTFILYSYIFFLIILTIFFVFGKVQFDYIFSYAWYRFDFYYSLLIYWYGYYGFYTLYSGVLVTIISTLYAVWCGSALSKRVLMIVPTSPLLGTLFAYFYAYPFIYYGFIGESFGWLLKYYLLENAFISAVFLQVLILFTWMPFSIWKLLWQCLVAMIYFLRIPSIFSFLWCNFFGWIFYFFRIKKKNYYIDDLIKKSIEKDFYDVITKYPGFGDTVKNEGEIERNTLSYGERYRQNLTVDDQKVRQFNQLVSQDEIQNMIEGLTHFGIFGTVEKVYKGPYLHTIIFTPDKTIKIQSIFAIQNDLGRIIGKPEIRIVYPVNEYRHSVAIEYPHYYSEIKPCYFLPYFLTEDYFGLPILNVLLGLDSYGKPFYFDVKNAPHMLIAGTTGSGKSSILNSIIFNFIWKYQATEVELFLIDPKKSEFFLYEKCIIVKDIAYSIHDIMAVLKKMIDIMDSRYAFFLEKGYKNIDECKANNNVMPYIIIIIDEYADIVLQSKIAEQYCLRLLQMARAAGIHMILATQRPSADIITGTLKSNMPTRIACRVINQLNSKIILDIGGAEKLLGKGDMIFLFQGKYVRLHGFYIDSAFILELYRK